MALSSTAFVLPVLAERGQLQNQGNATFAILLFQDLAVIPLGHPAALAVSRRGHGPAAAPTSGFMLAAKIIVALVGLVLAGRYLCVRPSAPSPPAAIKRDHDRHGPARRRRHLGADGKGGAVGPLGAFLSGVLLAESEYRHELHADIEPFKSLLLGLFFMAVGMSANLGIVRERPLALLGFCRRLHGPQSTGHLFRGPRFGQDRGCHRHCRSPVARRRVRLYCCSVSPPLPTSYRSATPTFDRRGDRIDGAHAAGPDAR